MPCFGGAHDTRQSDIAGVIPERLLSFEPLNSREGGSSFVRKSDAAQPDEGSVSSNQQ